MYTIPCVSFHSKNTHKRGIISNHFIYLYIYIYPWIYSSSKVQKRSANNFIIKTSAQALTSWRAFGKMFSTCMKFKNPGIISIDINIINFDSSYDMYTMHKLFIILSLNIHVKWKKNKISDNFNPFYQ